MDETLFVDLFCTRLANTVKSWEQMRIFYVWEDKRLGSVEERFRRDVSDFAEYERMRRP